MENDRTIDRKEARPNASLQWLLSMRIKTNQQLERRELVYHKGSEKGGATIKRRTSPLKEFEATKDQKPGLIKDNDGERTPSRPV